MPKYLYLLRHAESAQKQIKQSDKERELTPNGLREAMIIGGFLLKQGIEFDVIISSTASRAISTTQIVSDAMRANSDKIIPDEELYDASPRTFLSLINNLEDHLNSVMCVGHNPTISHLAEFLTNADISDMATAGLAIIKFNITSWREVNKGIGELANYVYPAMLLS